MTPQARSIERDNSSTWILNRTMFHSTLKKAFEQWIVKLRASNQTLRENMRRRMDEIISNKRRNRHESWRLYGYINEPEDFGEMAFSRNV